MTARSDNRRRLFFALWPADAVRERLVQEMQAHAPFAEGRPIPARNLHATLVFLGDTPQQRMEAALQAGAATAGVRCMLHLDRLEFWRRSNLLCLTAKQAPPALLALVDELRAVLLKREFEVREQAFRPHVTLVRDVVRGPPSSAIAPLHWPVEEFALVDSRVGPRGSEYTVVDRWVLPR